jgi:hypothetical protein
LPSNILICHKCDIPCCVNPNHLFQGTVQDNVTDMLNKNRGKSTLSNIKILKIRKKLKNDNKITYNALAKQYKVGVYTIRDIANYKNWKHLNIGIIPDRKSVV